MKTLLFRERNYLLTVVGCFIILISTSIMSTMILPDRPIINYPAYYGSNYFLYMSSNWIMLASFVAIFTVMGLLMAERIFRIRGYYETIQKEKRTED